MAGIGHNSGMSLDAVVEENLRRGLLLTQRDVLMRMSRDPRIKMKHMRIIVEIIERTNAQTGLAFPGRKRIAEDTRYIIPDVLESPDPYSESSVAKIVSDLIKWGYLVSERKAPREGGRAIAHYSIAMPTVEQLQQEITAYVESIRKRGRVGPPAIQARLPFGDDVPNGGNDRLVKVPPCGNDSDVPAGRNVSRDVPDGRNIRPPDVPPCRNDSDVPAGGNIRPDVPTGDPAVVPTGVPADVPTGDPTVTSKGTSLGTSSLSPPTPSRAEAQASEQRGGLLDLGHGVSFDGETIKHACFAIHVPSIEMRLMGVSVSKERVFATAKASALQWAVEIENGKSASLVVPQYIPGAISSALIREARYAEAHSAGMERRRAAQSSDHRGRVRFSKAGENHGRG